VLGIIQYGLFFNDASSMRQGVREVARAAVVENFVYPTCSGTNQAITVCAVAKQIGGITGSPAVKVYAPAGWAKGSPLRVCAAINARGALGLVPMPNGGNLRTLTQMTIEQDALKDSWDNAGAAVADPTGAGWQWC
jgi:Flp pilus assembly protein TadG